MCQCCAYIMDVFPFFLLSLTLSRLTSGFLVFLVFFLSTTCESLYSNSPMVDGLL